MILISQKFLDIAKLIGFLMAMSTCVMSNSLCAIGLGIYAGGLTLQALNGKPYEWKRFPSIRIVTALLACLTVSLLASHFFVTSLHGFGKYLQGFLLLYAAVDTIRSEREIKIAIFFLATSFMIAVSDGLFQSVFGYDFIFLRRPSMTEFIRITGPFKHYNDYGSFLVPGFAFFSVFLLDSAEKKDFKKTVLWTLLICLLFLALFRSMSRSGLISAAVSVFVFSLFFKNKWWGCFGTALAVALIWFIPSALSTRLHDLVRWEAGSMPERLMLAKTAVKMIQVNPFFGLGLNTYSIHFPMFRPAGYPGLMYAHNGYLQMAAEIGLLGIGAWLCFVFSLLKKFVQTTGMVHHSRFRTLLAALIAGISGMLTNAFFESTFQSTRLRFFLWSLMGLAAALSLYLRSAHGALSKETE